MQLYTPKTLSVVPYKTIEADDNTLKRPPSIRPPICPSPCALSPRWMPYRDEQPRVPSTTRRIFRAPRPPCAYDTDPTCALPPGTNKMRIACRHRVVCRGPRSHQRPPWCMMGIDTACRRHAHGRGALRQSRPWYSRGTLFRSRTTGNR